jgi:hypothetical protein
VRTKWIWAALAGLVISNTSAKADPYCGNVLGYTQNGNSGAPEQHCGGIDWTCNQPSWSGLTYSVQPGCNPQAITCNVTVTAAISFPGLHWNDNSFCGFTCTAGEVRLLNAAGALVDSCGVLGAHFTQDFG